MSKPTVTQSPITVIAPKAALAVPPVATPPATATGLNAFVSGDGSAGPEGKGAFTGKGQGK